MKTETDTKKRTQIFLDRTDLLELPALKAVLAKIPGTIKQIEVTFQVPGGGDWSGLDAPIDGKNPIKVVIESEEATQQSDLRPIPPQDECEVMSIEVFQRSVNAGSFVDDDGHGYYAIDDLMTNELAMPSAFQRGDIKYGFTKVVWFNK